MVVGSVMDTVRVHAHAAFAMCMVVMCGFMSYLSMKRGLCLVFTQWPVAESVSGADALHLYLLSSARQRDAHLTSLTETSHALSVGMEVRALTCMAGAQDLLALRKGGVRQCPSPFSQMDHVVLLLG